MNKFQTDFENIGQKKDRRQEGTQLLKQEQNPEDHSPKFNGNREYDY